MYSYRGKEIPKNSDDINIYHNLRTNRKIQKGDNNHYKIDINSFTHRNTDPRIYGTKEEILSFQEENKNLLGDIKLLGEPPVFEEALKNVINKAEETPPKYSAPYVPINAHIPVPIYESKNTCLLRNKSNCVDIKPPLPFENTIKPIITVIPKKIVEQKKNDYFPSAEHMDVLSFIGLRGKGKIIKVTGYNTLNILIYLKLEDLMKRKNDKSCILGDESLKDKGFFTIIPIKLAKIQKRKNAGLVKQIISDFYSDRRIVYYIFTGSTKNGTTIARIYEDTEHKECLNFKLNTELSKIHGTLNESISNSIKYVRPTIPEVKPFIIIRSGRIIENDTEDDRE